MPAHLRGPDPDGDDDLLGLKWVVGYPANGRLGLPAITALVVLNDPSTGLPVAILDGGPITAARTAAISGVAIRRFGPIAIRDGRPVRVAILGGGVPGPQPSARRRPPLPGAEVSLFDRHPERTEALAETARQTAGIAAAAAAGGAREAVSDADIVISAVSFGPVRQVMTDDWLAPDALVIPVDYATTCSAEVARGASLFVVDEIGQFLANRAAGQFDDYPDPATTIGAAIIDGVGRPPSGRVVATHLGTGLADLVLSRAIVRNATGDGLGTLLAR
jgi:ornithine cyclodeaminase/alanine dehydrogenase